MLQIVIFTSISIYLTELMSKKEAIIILRLHDKTFKLFEPLDS